MGPHRDVETTYEHAPTSTAVFAHGIAHDRRAARAEAGRHGILVVVVEPCPRREPRQNIRRGEEYYTLNAVEIVDAAGLPESVDSGKVQILSGGCRHLGTGDMVEHHFRRLLIPFFERHEIRNVRAHRHKSGVELPAAATDRRRAQTHRPPGPHIAHRFEKTSLDLRGVDDGPTGVPKSNGQLDLRAKRLAKIADKFLDIHTPKKLLSVHGFP